MPAPRARGRRLGGFSRPGAKPRGADGRLTRHRARELCRGAPGAGRSRAPTSASARPADRRHHRRHRAGPGRQDHAGADRRRRAATSRRPTIHVVAGDTAASPLGLGAFASRQAVTAGNAVHLAAHDRCRQGIRQAASSLMEASTRRSRACRRRGAGQRRAGDAAAASREIAKALAGVPGFALPAVCTPGLAAAVDFEPPALTYTNGCHVVEAEVDPETGGCRSCAMWWCTTAAGSSIR